MPSSSQHIISSSTTKICPYPGLRPFNEEESLYFKGREKHILKIKHELEKKKFLMVTGASGDGKSSLIYAGLLPQIKAGFFKAKFNNWAFVVFRPGNNPLANLASAFAKQLQKSEVKTLELVLGYGYGALIDQYLNSQLYHSDDSTQNPSAKKTAANLLIFVDQFEEFFSNTENFDRETAMPSEKSQIVINLLLETARIARDKNLPVYVICTMRSDYIGSAPAFRGLPEVIGDNQFFVPRLNRNEILDAITEPALLSDNKISMRLTQRILNDLNVINTDLLPVLQHALCQIWKAADNGNHELDLLQYAMAGGMHPQYLDTDDKEKFYSWFNLLPEYKKDLFDSPSIANILNMHANELFETAHLYINSFSISPADSKQIIETTFRCLTKIDDQKAVRNRMTLMEITGMLNMPQYDYTKVAEVINAFRLPGNTLIYPFITNYHEKTPAIKPDTLLDITHEALIRNWKLLSEWTNKEHESAQEFRELGAFIHRWLDNDKTPQHLLGVGTYMHFERWYEEQHPNSFWIKRYMLNTLYKTDGIMLSPLLNEKSNPIISSLIQKNDQQIQTDDTLSINQVLSSELLKNIVEFLQNSRAELDKKRRIRKAVITTISALLVAVVIAFFWANIKRKQAITLQNKISRLAHANEIATAAYLKLSSDPTLAYRLAEQAYFIEPTPLAKQVIMASYGEVPFYWKIEHSSAVDNAGYSPKGTYIFTMTKDFKTRIWSNSGKLITVLNGHKDFLPLFNSGNFSEDETHIVTCARDSTARIWNLEGKCLAVLKHDGPVNSAYFSPKTINELRNDPSIQNEIKELLQKEPKGEYLVLTASSDKTARLWDMEGKELVRFEGHGKGVRLAKFSPKTEIILTASADSKAILWNINGEKLMVLKEHNSLINDVAFSNMGDKILTTSYDSTTILRTTNGKIIAKMQLGDKGYNCIFSSDDKFILNTSPIDLIGTLWDTDGKKIKDIQGHTAGIWSGSFSPNNNKFVTASDDGTARLWNLEGTELMLFKGHTSQVMSANFSPDGKYVVTASGDATARVWNVEMKENPVFKGHTGYVYDANFSPYGNYIVTAGWDYTARIWNITGELKMILKGHDHYVTLISDFINSKILYTTSPDGKFILWNEEGKQLKKVAAHDGPPTKVIHMNDNIYVSTSSHDNNFAFWKDTTLLQRIKKNHLISKLNNNLLLSLSIDSSLYLWQQKKQTDSIHYVKFKTIKISGTAFTSAEFSTDNKWFLTTSSDSIVRLWNFEYLQIRKDQPSSIWSFKHPADISLIKFSPDGKHILTIAQDNIGRLFQTDEIIKNPNSQILNSKFLRGHSGNITDANFSDDSKYIVTGALDFAVRIWDLNGNTLQMITNHTSALNKVKFSSDGKYILSCANDKTARLTPWRVEDVMNKINVEKVRGEVWNLKEKDKEVFGIK